VTGSSIRRRADAERNRERLLEATRIMLAQRGTRVSMDEIARAAGLGSGTLYRHFPHRGALLAAVITEHLVLVSADIYQASTLADPLEALRAAMHALAAHVAANRAVHEALLHHIEQRDLGTTPDLVAARTRALDLLDQLVHRAQDAGVLRTDIAASDLPLVLGVIGRINLPKNDLNLWERYFDLLIDGLRTPTPSQLSHQPPHTWWDLPRQVDRQPRLR